MFYNTYFQPCNKNSNPPFFPKDKEREVHMESIFKEAWQNDDV